MPSHRTPSTNLSTGLSTKPTRLNPDYLTKSQNFVPLSVFFSGVPEAEADPDSLFGYRMPERKKKVAPPKEKKAKGGTSNSKDDKVDKNDDSKDKGEKEKESPQKQQTAQPRTQQPTQSQPEPAQAQGAKQESKGTINKRHKCELCSKEADKRVIWAHGRAFLPACSDHVDAVKKMLKKKNGSWAEIVGVRTVKTMSEGLSCLLDMTVNKRVLGEVKANEKSIALMGWLSKVARDLKVGRHVYVVGGAVRNFVIDQPIKDIDMVVDSIAIGKDSEWLAGQIQKKIPVKTNLSTNQYGVAILTVKEDWQIGEHNFKGEVIEIANARSESYGGASGKGYKPSEIKPATIEKDIKRREFTFNTLMWRLADLATGPEKAEIVDITGCGLSDLKANTMRCPVNPDKTFSDDPTRMLRAIKFMIKYGFKISGDTEASIRKNAKKIRNAPSSAIVALLIDPILKDPKTAALALKEMKRLGLLDVVSEMIRNDQSFRSTMTNWASDQRVAMLFDLLDVGLPLKTRLNDFSPQQQKRIREITIGMPDKKALEFLVALKQPGKAWRDKMFFPSLVGDPKLQQMFSGKRGVRDLAAKINDVARFVLLAQPALFDSPSKLKIAIKKQLFLGEGMTTTANVPTLPVPIGAGDGRKFLDYGDGHPNKKKKKKRSLSRKLYLLLRQ